MAVYDRWHKDPGEGEQPCKCGRGRNRLYPSAVHGQGKRWQVRWDDPNAPKRRQPRRNFALRDPGPGEKGDPEKHASAFNTVITASIVTRTYTDPKSAEQPLRDFAEQWRKAQKMDVNEAADTERRLRLHVYEGEPGSGRTPKGGVSIGQHALGVLAARPSLTAAWIAAMPLADSSALHVVVDVSSVFAAAMDDGIVGRDPTKSPSVERPSPGRTLARAWSVEQVDAQAAELAKRSPRWRIVPELGAATGMRKGEMLGLGTGDIQFLGKSPHVSVVRSLKIIDGELRFGPVKNRKEHQVPLAKSLAGPLARHLREFPARKVTLPWHDPSDRERHGLPCTVDLVITGDAAAAVHPLTFNYHWMAARKLAGITPEGRRGREDGCHALRHTFASAQLRKGTDVGRIAAWMGDTVEMVVKTYLHLMPGDDGDADGRAAVDDFFAQRGACALDVPSEAAE